MLKTREDILNKNPDRARGKRVFVGLSGGVDSALSAALLKDQGFDVTGVFIKGWQPDWLPCTWREERRDAMRVAVALDIPFLFFDFEKEYKQAVVDKMLEEYRHNRTPNPDVLCNRMIKFGLFWEKAKELGADFIATGHYAINQLAGDSFQLMEGEDKEKDQSYFLWTLTQNDLSHTLFPVGHLEKSEVRALAKKLELPNAEKKDSQGICFMGSVSMNDFLSKFIASSPGAVVDGRGNIIGAHRGLIFYTIGERHGFEITKKSASSGPFYVIAKDVEKNRLVVSDKKEEIISSSPKRVLISDTNWFKKLTTQVSARIRHRGEKHSCVVFSAEEGEIVEFDRSVPGLSLGQSIVFYNREECIGGAIMSKVVS